MLEFKEIKKYYIVGGMIIKVLDGVFVVFWK